MDMNMLEKGYEPKEAEKRWYDFWEKENLFGAGESGDNGRYSIVIPPPNVTGFLHMGHALNITLQDILCRYRRHRGDDVLWMPGTDHAGIATQNVVENKLAAEGRNRHQVGREQFIEEVWQWREKYGGIIINQLKRMGASCDWRRERFTMDEGLSLAVRKVFVQLYAEGLIYRGDYIINWCPRCNTALADLEVEHEETDGNLYHILYPFVGHSDGVIVATTRPETMLGDTAVAVHPEDARFFDLRAEAVVLPLMDREIPVIRDNYVDMAFGAGALKVTPAHDPNDFELGRAHDLPAVKVIGDDGKMTAEAGKYEGMDRFECRKAVVRDLDALKLLKKIEPHKHNVGACYRCKSVVEPNLSRQWFVRAKPLAEKAIAAVREKETRIIPDVWEKTYYDWMENIRDWCISRQIWWGHQIPAWTCQSCGEMTVAMTAPETCPACGDKDLIQESDVLDTWFSSALWPFSTMGWPETTPLLKRFYPTSVLVTGFDILFFWVARMMMMGIHFMGEVPFRDVYIHALVRDEDGKKMSKSKGNVIDPLQVIDAYGTDAFRMTLTAFAAQGRDVKMSEKRVEGYRHFVNKLWNAARFSLPHLTDGRGDIPYDRLALPDRWILSRLRRITDDAADALDGYRFNEAAALLYQFVWHEFCDWYLEIVKPVLYDKKGEDRKQATVRVLWRILKDVLVLLHPIIPFVTEEIWHKLPGVEGSVMKAPFPGDGADGVRTDPGAESQMVALMAVITGIRTIRGEMNIPPSASLDIVIHAEDAAVREVAEMHADIISNLARVKTLTVAAPGKRPASAATAIVDGAAVYAPLEGVIDFEKETQRLKKEIDKVARDLNAASRKLNNEDFLAKAPEDVVDKVREKHAALVEKEQKLRGNLERIETMRRSDAAAS